MNKKVLTTAMGAALAASMGFAQAGDVTVYGNVNVSIDSWDVDTVGDDINMESNTSAVGVKGSEDLGNGLKALFQVEFQFDASERNANGGTTDRDQFVGLAGNFGKVRLGTLSNSYKSHGAMIDPIYRTSLQNRDSGLQSSLHSGAGETGGRMTNHVRYDSPDFNGFGVTVDYSFDNDEGDGENNDSYGIGGQYKNGGILVFADYLTNDNGGDLDDVWKVGGSYMYDMFGIYAQYEAGGLLGVNKYLYPNGDTAISANSATKDATQWMIAGSATMGNTMLYVGFGQADELDGAAYSHDAITLAVDHKLSKRTDVYAGWANVDEDNSGIEADLVSVGIRHKF